MNASHLTAMVTLFNPHSLLYVPRLSSRLAFIESSAVTIARRRQPPPDNLFLFQSVIGRRYNTD
jgi:hypothetical protein